VNKTVGIKRSVYLRQIYCQIFGQLQEQPRESIGNLPNLIRQKPKLKGHSQADIPLHYGLRPAACVHRQSALPRRLMSEGSWNS
jgi:hypothetical protein